MREMTVSDEVKEHLETDHILSFFFLGYFIKIVIHCKIHCAQFLVFFDKQKQLKKIRKTLISNIMV